MRGENLNLNFGVEQIFEDTSFFINDNDKVGIVGVNGAGKTTLFKVILGYQELNSGKIVITNNKRIGYLPQEIILDNKDVTVFDYLMSARPIKELEDKLATLYEKVAIASDKEQNKIMKAIANTQAKLEYYDYYKAESILFELLDNMHIDGDLLDMKLVNLSGGQKSKIAFAHLLYSKPEILLLDEPTNHLDVDTRDYVINYLKRYKGMVLIISHDVDFLDKITDHTLHLNKVTKKITMFEGNYTTYLKKSKALAEAKEKLIQKQEKEEKKLRDIVLLYSNSSGKRKRMAQSREKQLNKMLKNHIERDKTYKKVKLNIKPKREGSKIPLTVNNIDFSYNNKDLIINNLSFVVNNHERFLIVGENGVGKSTLLKLIMGILETKDGSIKFGNKTNIAYYAQEQENLDLKKNILLNVDNGEYSEKELRTILGSFLFYGDEVFKQVKYLSPGEKARVSLCKVMLEKANLLLLDEPTNHLDPETQRIIGENFKNYEGTIILVSHNPSFVKEIGIDRMLMLPSGKIVNFDDDILNYYYKINTKK